MPDDKETLELDGKRVFIDKHKTNPTKVFRITKTDDTLYDFGKEHGGIFSLSLIRLNLILRLTIKN